MASWLAWMSSLKRKAKSCCHMLCSWFWGASQITGSEVIATHCTNDWLRAVKWLSVEYWVIIKDSVFATESYDTFERKKLNDKFFYEQQCSLDTVSQNYCHHNSWSCNQNPACSQLLQSKSRQSLTPNSNKAFCWSLGKSLDPNLGEATLCWVFQVHF